jgi:hypothetical protein
VDGLALLFVVVLLAAVIAVVGLPLRSTAAEAADERERRDVEGLEEAKQAKYREIRDLEMDFRTGKLSQEDFRAQDRARRAEAVELLRRLDALGAGPGAAPVAARREADSDAA